MGKGRIVKGAKIGEAGDFVSTRKIPLSKNSMSIRFPADISDRVQAKGREWIREAIRKALESEDTEEPKGIE